MFLFLFFCVCVCVCVCVFIIYIFEKVHVLALGTKSIVRVSGRPLEGNACPALHSQGLGGSVWRHGWESMGQGEVLPEVLWIHLRTPGMIVPPLNTNRRSGFPRCQSGAGSRPQEDSRKTERKAGASLLDPGLRHGSWGLWWTRNLGPKSWTQAVNQSACFAVRADEAFQKARAFSCDC